MQGEVFTVQQAARQIGCSLATVRAWIAQGKLTSISGSRPAAIERESVLRARAAALARFDGVVDAYGRGGEPVARSSLEEEVARLRQRLRTIVASVDSFDAGVSSLRAAQRMLLDGLLDDLSDLTPIEE